MKKCDNGQKCGDIEEVMDLCHERVATQMVGKEYRELLAEQTAMQSGTQQGGTVRRSAVSDDDDTEEIKLSKSKQKEYERKIIAEARRRQAEKYGEEYNDNDDDD